MAKLSVEKVCERAKKGFSERDQNRQLFEDCYDYMLPFRNTFTSQNNSQGNQSFNRPNRQYDSTAQKAGANFVNTMQANFTPVFSRWAELKTGPGIPEKDRTKLDKELEKLTDTIFAYLNASNFATASAEMYFDWGIGTGALWLFEGNEEQPLNFIATPMSQLGLVEGKFGTVDSRFRQHKIKRRLIKETWGDADLGELEDSDNQDEEIELIEACYYDSDEFIWRYEVIHEGTKHRLVERVSTEEFCFTPRWLKIPGHAYGVGPFMLALLDVKTLNKMKEYMLRSAALNIFGVYTVASGGTFNPNTVNLQPGTFIPVERNGGPNGPSIAELPRTGSFEMQEFMIRDLQDSVRQTMLDNRLPPDQPQPKTAYEIAQRIKEFQQDIGSAYGRAMYEFVQPLFKRIIAILSRKGLIQLPEGFTIDNFFVQIQVVSPIAQTQALEDVQKLVNSLEIVGSIAPQLVLTAYEIEKLPQWLSEKTGSPAAMLREDAEQENLRNMIMQAAQQIAQEQMKDAAAQ